MGLDACLANAVAAGEIRNDKAEAQLERLAELKAEYLRLPGMDATQAEAAALADLKATARAAARKRYHAALNQARVAREISTNFASLERFDLAIEALLEPWAQSGYTGHSVRTLSQAYARQAYAMMREALDAYRTTALGQITNRMSFLNMVRELHGVDTGDAVAKKAAEGYRAAKEFLRQSFNELGGDIAYLADHGMVHTHDAIKLLKAGREAWVRDIFDLLDWHRIENPKTGKTFTSEPGGRPNRAAAEEFLAKIYDNITTRGVSNREPSFAIGGQALWNQHAEHRVLHFKGDGWLTYNEKFGTTDAFSAMLQGIQGMANDVAQMRVLGPSPRAGLEFAIQTAQKRAADLMALDPVAGAKMADRVRKAAIRARAQLAHVTGAANVPGSLAAARFFRGTRAWLVASQLGRAILAAPSDLITASTAALVAGMNPANTLARVVKLLVSPSERQLALQMGHMLDAMIDAGGGSARWWGEHVFTGFAEKAAHIQMRASGLAFWTDMVRTAVRMEHGATLARNAHLAFDALPGQLRRSLERRGITAGDWDLLRDPAHHFVAPNGARFITPYYWLESAAEANPAARSQYQALSLRLAAGLEDEIEASVPTASLAGRAKLADRPGTLKGEALGSALQYKSYSLSLMFKQFDQLSRIQGTGWKASFMAGTVAGLTAMGALKIQLNELSKGNDPRPMNDPAFWGAALLQGGGLGIFGDFFSASQSRAGTGIAGTALGPVASLVNDLAQRVVPDGMALATGKGHARPGRHLVDLTRRYTPVLSSLWWAALPYDRWVSDTLQTWLDPEARQAFVDAERKKSRDYATRPWWGHGQALPTRAPDLSNVLGAPK